MNELKPCPFCGNDKPMIHARTCDKGDRYDPADRAFPIVRCHTCGCCAEGTDWSEPKTAIEKWNRRTAPEGMAMVPYSFIVAANNAKKITAETCRDFLAIAAAHINGLADLILAAAKVKP